MLGGIFLSSEHKLFLKQKKKEKNKVLFFRIAILVIFLLSWEILARCGVINTFLTTCPTEVLRSTYTLMKDGSLFNHISITLYEILLSFVISFILSFIIACIMWMFPFIHKVLDPYLTVLNSLPKVSLGPLIIIWAGAGTKSIILMGILISIFVTTLNLYQAFSTVPEYYVKLMRSFGANKEKIFRYVIVPSNRKNILSSLKVNLSMNYIGVIMGELLVSKKGLGYLINYGSSVFHISLVITSVCILCFLSYIMYYLVELLEKK